MSAVLTAKQQRFIEEYLVDLNASAAARRAGYSVRRADQQGLENLRKPEIAAAIAAARAALSERAGVTLDRIAQELARLALVDVRRMVGDDGAPLPLGRLDEDTARAIVAVEIVSVGNAAVGVGQVLKLKFADKGANLERLARLLGYYERDNKQKNPLGGFDGAAFFASMFSKPEGHQP